jgi:hypothetical protein
MTDGENIIYHYIQKTLLSDNVSDEFSKELIERLIIDLSIWFPPDVYQQVPILLPFVIRDNSCRKKKPNSSKDEWGCSNEAGFLRDDNSLIKGIIKTFFVDGRRVKDYNNKKLANGFVASHIWRKLQVNEDKLASTYEKTNSFIPNLVWLPKQISKLTDREGSYAQNLLKTISYKIYFDHDNTTPFKQDIWIELNNPQTLTKTNIDVSQLNYFKIPNIWVDKKRNGVLGEMQIIKNVITNGTVNSEKVKCSSYLPTLLTKTSNNAKQNLISWLDKNIDEIGHDKKFVYSD